jgi:hypothetical protein
MPFLPLLNARQTLLVLEILSFGIKYPNFIVFTTSKHQWTAFEFRKTILYQFSESICNEILNVLNKSSLTKFEKEYSLPEKSQGKQWLDCVILAAGGELPCTEHEYMHWKIYFAMLLLQFA